MSRRERRPVRVEGGEGDPPVRRSFWEKYGWQTTLSLSVGIGAVGLLQFFVGLAVVPIHPMINALASLVLLLAAPLLVVAGVTAFLLPVQSAVRHVFLDG